MLSICREFLSNCRQRVVFDGATRCQPNRFWRATEKCVGSSSIHPLYQWNVWAGGEQTIYVYADASTLLAVVRKPADRSAVAASLNMVLARIQEWCNHWCIILNSNKTKAFVVGYPGLWTLPMVTWFCLGFPFVLVPTSIFLAWSLTEGSPSKTMRAVLSLVSQRIGILMLVKHFFMDTSVLLRCYYAFVLPILEYCTPVWGSASECHLQLLERQVYSVARLFPDQTFLSLCHRHPVASLCIFYKVNSNSNHCLFNNHSLVASLSLFFSFPLCRYLWGCKRNL